ncbi:MAG: hypothetical protein GXP38_14605 [Chloroflexi bacterium]|nr:hypothetical protein [Chloroflexota bacterium]
MAESFQDPRLHFLWLEVRNLEKSIVFYQETLGFAVEKKTENLAIVSLANTQLYLATGVPHGSGVQIAIAVPDIDALHQRLASHQVYLPHPTDQGWARYLRMIDPDGYHLIFVQLRDNS